MNEPSERPWIVLVLTLGVVVLAAPFFFSPPKQQCLDAIAINGPMTPVKNDQVSKLYDGKNRCRHP